jgi:hypothetical protein
VGALKKLEFGSPEPAEAKELKQVTRKYKRVNGLLTPMSKYYASEMSMRVANGSMAVLAGSGYMKDYPVERHLRDSRITTIYEGTSQLQVVAAVRGVCSGAAETVVNELLDGPSADSAQARQWPEDLQPLIARIRAGLADLVEAAAFTKAQSGGTEYMDLYARKLVDMAITLVVGALFCDQAAASEKKKAVAHRWLAAKMPELKMCKQMVLSGDRQAVTQFETLAGPVPVPE